MLQMLQESTWKTVACITDHSLESSSDDIDANSKCGPETIPGDLTWTSPIGGFFDLTPAVDQISGEELLTLAQAQTEQQFRMRNADNTYFRSFFATISNYSEDAAVGTVVSFSADLLIRGSINQVPIS